MVAHDMRPVAIDVKLQFAGGVQVVGVLVPDAGEAINGGNSHRAHRARPGVGFGSRAGVPLREYLLRCEQSDLTKCGVSRAKSKALVNMAQSIDDGLFCEAELQRLDYDEVIAQVTQLWGFGKWSGDMVAMFFVKLPDVWPAADTGLVRGMKLLAPGEDPECAATHYSPYRTYLARQIWTSLDTGTIGKV